MPPKKQSLYSEVKMGKTEPKGIKVQSIEVPYKLDRPRKKAENKKLLEKINLMIKERQPKFDPAKYLLAEKIKRKATESDYDPKDEILQRILKPFEYEAYKNRKMEEKAKRDRLHEAILNTRNFRPLLEELRDLGIQQLAAQGASGASSASSSSAPSTPPSPPPSPPTYRSSNAQELVRLQQEINLLRNRLGMAPVRLLLTAEPIANQIAQRNAMIQQLQSQLAQPAVGPSPQPNIVQSPPTRRRGRPRSVPRP